MLKHIPEVSFIVPVYNVPSKMLIRCIESLIYQTYENIEIILVNDGSTDSSGSICDSYEREDSRITTIHQENKGLSGARNTGFLNAIGNYISFVDGDDWVEESFCEELLKYKGQDIIISSIIKDFSTRVKYLEYPFDDEQHFTKSDRKFLQNKVLDFYANISGVYSKLINRNFLVEHKLQHNESLKQGAEGIEFNFRLFAKVNSVVFLNQYFYHYMYNESSISSFPSDESNKLTILCFSEIKSYIKDKESSDNELLSNLYTRILYFIVTTVISSYFHPKNINTYNEKKKKTLKFMEHPLIKETLQKGDFGKLDFQRKIIIFLVSKKLFWFIKVLSGVRYKQKA